MSNKLFQLLMIVLFIVNISLPTALSASSESTYISETVASVGEGKSVILTYDGKKEILSVPTEILKGVKPGHEVDVELVDSKRTVRSNSTGVALTP